MMHEEVVRRVTPRLRWFEVDGRLTTCVCALSAAGTIPVAGIDLRAGRLTAEIRFGARPIPGLPIAWSELGVHDQVSFTFEGRTYQWEAVRIGPFGVGDLERIVILLDNLAHTIHDRFSVQGAA